MDSNVSLTICFSPTPKVVKVLQLTVSTKKILLQVHSCCLKTGNRPHPAGMHEHFTKLEKQNRPGRKAARAIGL